MYILGISCFYHDSAACLVRDGKIVAAAQEERFTRKKHDARFPINAIKSCLRETNITIADVDYFVYYDKPLLTFERLLLSYLTVAPKGLRSWLQAMPLWLGQKLHIPKVIEKEKPSLVIMARSHRPDWLRRIFGSVADRLASKVDCSVVEV